jgi:glycosyltransferase involved in cell wall biosynthesis
MMPDLTAPHAVAPKAAAHVGILATAEQRHGGTLLYTLSMIEALKQLPSERYRFRVFTMATNHEYDKVGLPVTRLSNARALMAGRVAGRDPFATVDKIIAPIYSTALLTTKRPFAFTLHDLQEKYYPQHFTRLTRAWRHTTNRLLTARASRILCESHFVERDIVRFFKVPPSRIAVVPAPPVSQLAGDAAGSLPLAEIRAKFNLPDTYIFYPAQFWPHKNHRRLVEAFALINKMHPGCVLVLTGKARDEYDSVFQRINELGLAAHVRHVGYVEQVELAALYQAATVVAVPTLFESISLPVYEAFSLGTAVCASNVVALPEQIGDAGLLFDPLSVDDIAAKISTLLASPDLRQQLIARGRQRMANVSHTDYALQLSNILDAMVPRP